MKKLHAFDEVFDGQQVFRRLLNAMAHPGRRVSIAPFAARFAGVSGALMAIALTLLDNEVSFHALEDPALGQAMAELTLSREAPLENADFVLLCNEQALERAIARVKCGTLRDPQQGATLIVNDAGADLQPTRLYGPGIDGIATVMLSAAARRALAARDAQHYEYPQGIDLMLVTGEGELMALPRLTLQEVR